MNSQSSNPIGSLVGVIMIFGLVFYFLTRVNILVASSFLLGVILLVAFIVLLGGLRIIDQFERGVVLTLGKYTSTRNPGLTWILMGIQKMIKIDMRVRTVDIPQQEVITKDNEMVTKLSISG